MRIYKQICMSQPRSVILAKYLNKKRNYHQINLTKIGFFFRTFCNIKKKTYLHQRYALIPTHIQASKSLRSQKMFEFEI